MIQFFLRFLGLSFLPMQAFCKLFSTRGMVTLRQFLDLPKNPLANLKYFFLLNPAINNNNFKLQMEKDQSEYSNQQLILAIQKYDWSDTLSSQLGDTPTNSIYQLLPEKQYEDYYRMFRFVLNTEEISERCFVLTTLLLNLKMSSYYAMMLRKQYFTSLTFDIMRMAKQIGFINHLLAQNSKEYQLWTYKKHLLKLYKQECKNHSFYELQLEFLQDLLQQDSKNYHVWDYRLWLTTHFEKEKEELQLAYHRIFIEPTANKKMKESLQNKELQLHVIQWQNCYSLWSYRYNLSNIFYSKQQNNRQQFLLEELKTVKKFLEQSQNIGSECGWNYYVGLALDPALSSNQKLKEIFLEACQIFQRQNSNRFVGNACIQLLEALHQRKAIHQPQKRRDILEAMKKLDKVRQLYYDYLLKM